MEEVKNNRDWVAKYIDYLLVKDFKACLELKESYLPKSLFKFRSLNDKTLESLEQKYFRFSKISSLNDPFECSIQANYEASLRLLFGSNEFLEYFKKTFNVEFSNKEIEKLVTSEKTYITFEEVCRLKGVELLFSVSEHIKEVEKGWTKVIEEMNENIKVCCLSERNDSLLMWSHYADKHKGICIEYDFENENNISLHPILYNNEIHKINTFHDLNAYTQAASTLTKCKEWEYEAEWRLITLRKTDSFPDTIDATTPKAIYLGTRFHLNKDEEIEQLRKIAKEQNIPLYQMGKHPTEYKLVKIE